MNTTWQAESAGRYWRHDEDTGIAAVVLAPVGGGSDLLLRLRYFLRLNDSDARISKEIMLIEREYVGDAVNVHRRHEPRIVYLYSGDGMDHHESPPFRMYTIRIRQERKGGFNEGRAPIRFRDA